MYSGISFLSLSVRGRTLYVCAQCPRALYGIVNSGGQLNGTVLRPGPPRGRLYRLTERKTPMINLTPTSWVLLFVGCLTSQQHASVSQGRICSDNFTCCHTEIEVADQTFYLTQSQYTDTGPTSPSTDPVTPRRLAG